MKRVLEAWTNWAFNHASQIEVACSVVSVSVIIQGIILLLRKSSSCDELRTTLFISSFFMIVLSMVWEAIMAC